MINLLITGASGFVGTAVRSHLSGDPDFSIRTLSLRGDGWKGADLRGVDAVLHAAGIAHVDPSPAMEKEYERVNHRLTVEFAAYAKEQGVRQFIFLSSMIVFGAAAPAGTRKTIAPDTPPAPENAYGTSKLDAENGLRRLESADFRAAILRPPMVYGPGCKGNYVTLVKLAKRLPVFPDFENYRSMLYIENLSELIRLLALEGAGGTFHPRDGAPKSVTEIVRAVCRSHGKAMRFTRAFNPLLRLAGRGGIVRRAFGDMAYAPEMPDFGAKYRIFDFEEAIRRTEGGAPWQA